jgi:hypothetical protein
MEKVKGEEDEGSDYEDGQSATMCRRVMCAQHYPAHNTSLHAIGA